MAGKSREDAQRSMSVRSATMMLAISVALLLVLAGAFAYTNSCEQREPSIINEHGFAKEASFNNCTDLLFNDEITRYPSSATVMVYSPEDDRVTLGFVVDPFNLNFGVVPYGDNYITRFVMLKNLKDDAVKVSFRSFGNISRFVNYSMNDFILDNGESATVDIRFLAKDAVVGNYTGQIDVIVKKPTHEFMHNLGIYDFGSILFGGSPGSEG